MCESYIISKKINNPLSINEIRNDGFQQTFSLIPDAVKRIISGENLPLKQNKSVRTNKYKMHPFIKVVLKNKIIKKV